MKKIKILSDLFWGISVLIMLLVILQHYKFIHFLPTTPTFFHERTLETITLSEYYTCFINGIGYFFLVFSISIKFFLFTENEPIRLLPIKNKPLKIFIFFLKILFLVFTITILMISLLMTLFSLITLTM